MRYPSCLAVGLTLLNAGLSPAQEMWRATEAPNRRIAILLLPSVPDGLPDGRVVHHEGEIASAWYGGPTTRYGHGILGDAIEASILHVERRDGGALSLELPETEVFEDRYPRLADLDGDGTTEIVTIRSSVTLGASVTVYGVMSGRLRQRAATGFIGQPNRWLNIAGIASFLGNGKNQIAYVRTPHIGGTLFFWEFDEGELRPVGSVDGFSNHVTGSREMRLSAITDIDGDGRMELALPSDDRRRLRIVGFRGGTLTELSSVRLPAPIDKAIAVKGTGPAAHFFVGLDNGKNYKIHR